MTPVLSRLRAGLANWAHEEDGHAAVAFALIFPLFFVLFTAAFEIGLFTVRQTILERAVDVTVRAIRLGQMPNPDHDTIKTMICDNAPSLVTCNDTLKISLERVSTTTWAMPSTQLQCTDRAEPLNPVGQVDPDPQAPQVLMIMRVCLTADAMFPGTGFGASLQKDGQGGYYMNAMTAFLNEP